LGRLGPHGWVRDLRDAREGFIKRERLAICEVGVETVDLARLCSTTNECVVPRFQGGD
jgi:hypothetical protein